MFEFCKMVKESGKGSEKGSGNGKIDIKDYTRFEIARIVGARALQISMDAPILVKLGKGGLEELNYDPLRIARK